MARIGRTCFLSNLSPNRLQRNGCAEESRFMSMLPWRSTAAVALACALAVGTSCSVLGATKTKAKAKVTPAPSLAAYGLSKLYVPASMVKGSLVTTGRAFYRSSQPESTLAGIRLGRSANTILAKWGNPTRITTGAAEAEVAEIPAPSPSGPNYIPPGGGSPMGAFGEGLNKAASILGLQNSPLPSLGGYEAPGMPPMPGGMPGQMGPGGTTTAPQTKMLRQEEVTWTYDLPNGITLEFIITDGLITQITVGGEGPWALSKTRTGLQLGDSYKLVLWVCGFPKEPQRYVGRFLRVSYVDTNRVLFTFLNKKLVGVTIAMVPNELLQQ